jgi:hypothetical protein
MIMRGQLDGGAVQGTGQALGEHVLYDATSGQVVTASTMDYFVGGYHSRFRAGAGPVDALPDQPAGGEG